MSSLEHLFRTARQRWGGNGSGSTPEKTATMALQLPRMLRQLGVRHLVDLGCGDVTWMAQVALSDEAGLEAYTGIDVCADVIERNRRQYPVLMFKHGGASVLPACDAVITRDCLAHLPNQVVLDALQRVARAASLLLATTFPLTRSNRDLKVAGDYRPLNLALRPFNLGQPDYQITDSDHKVLGVWRIRDRAPFAPPR